LGGVSRGFTILLKTIKASKQIVARAGEVMTVGGGMNLN